MSLERRAIQAANDGPESASNQPLLRRSERSAFRSSPEGGVVRRYERRVFQTEPMVRDAEQQAGGEGSGRLVVRLTDRSTADRPESLVLRAPVRSLVRLRDRAPAREPRR